jgi:cell division protein ZapA (FtsZ GTPase activity inhibitor)
MKIAKIKFSDIEMSVTCEDPNQIAAVADALSERANTVRESIGQQKPTDVKLLLLTALSLQHDLDNLLSSLQKVQDEKVAEINAMQDMFTETLNSIANYMENLAERLKV